MAFPILAGLALGSLMGGGIAALQKKDILQGALMGGVGGALGGAFMPGIAGGLGGATGTGSLSSLGVTGTEALNQLAAQGVTGAAGGAGGAGATSSIMAGAPGAGVLVNGSPLLTQAIPSTVAPAAVAGAGGGAGAGSGIGSFLSANKYPLLGGVAGGMLAGDKEGNPADTGNIYTTAFKQERNPEFGMVAGASPFTQSYDTGSFSKAKDYNPTMTAANGGIVALAEGGRALELEPYNPVETNRYAAPARTMSPEVAAYNQQLMANANQQYNINPRPLPLQVPGSPGYVAPTFSTPASSGSGEFGYDPATQRYTGISGLAKKEMTELERMREEMDMMRNEQGGYNFAAGDSGDGGMANGGLSSLGDYSDGGRLLKGPGDGVSDDIPARIGARQPARLADGEFVIPARTVSEIGNGSTEAGAKRLYAMMDRVQKARKKSIGKGKVAVDSKAHKMLPA